MTERDLLFELQCLSRSTARKRFRKDIFAAWDHQCAYCGKPDPMTLDHVVPKSKGGMTVRANLIPSCGDCNLKKSNMTWMLFFRQQEFWTLEREQNILNWVNKDHSYIETAKEYETLCKEPLLLPALEDAA